MTQQIERRRAERRTEADELSPEYLALLQVCGGEVRAGDRAYLTQRRLGTESEDPEAKVAESEEPARLRADRRASKP
jgi:hypothetical protein